MQIYGSKTAEFIAAYHKTNMKIKNPSIISKFVPKYENRREKSGFWRNILSTAKNITIPTIHKMKKSVINEATFSGRLAKIVLSHTLRMNDIAFGNGET